MKTILLPLGEPLEETANMPYVIKLAKLLKAKIIVSKLYKEPLRSGGLLEGNLSMEKITYQELDSFVEGYEHKGVKVSIKPLEGGNWVEAIGALHQKHDIDLVVLTPENHDVKESNYLGEVSGSILKNTEFPVLVLPVQYEYRPIQRMLMAVKSGIVKSKRSLEPVKDLKKAADAELRLLQVKTADYLPEDSEFNETLGKIVDSYKATENATLFQGLLEHLNENNPDIVCVFRRKRGFFTMLWEDNVVKKADFESRLPLLVLKGAE